MSKLSSQSEDSAGFVYPKNQATNLLQLTDTPNSYSGAGGKVVAVKDDETGVEFVVGGTGSGVEAFTELTDVPSTYSGSALKVVQVNSTADGLEFVALGGGGDALTSNPLSQFAATTSAQLRAVLSDETGTGSAYFAGGNAGTPSAINLANGTALPVTGITASTSAAIGVGTVELGHATDTTLSRLSAGVAAVEGVAIITTANISDTAYDATTWNNDSTHAPSKNAVRDKFESLSLSGNDANGNYSADNFLHAVDAITAAAGTTTLSVASAYEQRVTGSTTQTVKLPVVSTLALGTTFLVRNLSSGVVTVQSSGSNNITTLPANTAGTFSSNAITGTAASVWDVISNATLLTTSNISDAVYDATAWNGDTTNAPSKNAVRDKIEALLLSGGGDALTSNPLSQFAATTSLQFKGVISDETGSGAVVFANTPTLVTPDIGVPGSGTLTNCTGLPVAGITASTSTALGVGSIELGHATDTTLSRSAAGVLQVEGVTVSTASNTLSLSNKTIATGSNTIQTYTNAYSSNQSLSAAECYGGVIYVTSAATMALPAVVSGMQVTVVSQVAGSVNIDPNGTEVINLDGTALSAGFQAKSPGALGDIITLTYRSAGVWYAASNTWTNNGS